MLSMEIPHTKRRKCLFMALYQSSLFGYYRIYFYSQQSREFGGRVFCLEKANRIKAILITILGNMGQLLATIIFGTLALVYYLYTYSGFLDGEADYWFIILLFVAATMLFMLVALYLNASWFTNFSISLSF